LVQAPPKMQSATVHNRRASVRSVCVVSSIIINCKNLRHERLLGGGMGSTECRSSCYLFLLKTQSPYSGRSPFWICTIFLFVKSGGRLPFEFSKFATLVMWCMSKRDSAYMY